MRHVSEIKFAQNMQSSSLRTCSEHATDTSRSLEKQIQTFSSSTHFCPMRIERKTRKTMGQPKGPLPPPQTKQRGGREIQEW